MNKLLWLALFICEISVGSERQCDSYQKHLTAANKHGIKAHQTPEFIFYSEAKCKLGRGDNSGYEQSLFYGSILGDPMAISRYSIDLLRKSDDFDAALVLLASMMNSKKEGLAFNGKFFLGLYFSAAKKVINIDHLSTSDLRDYGVELLNQATDFEFGSFDAFYVLAALNKAKNNPDWLSFVAKGDDAQKKHVGSIQRTCTQTIDRYSKDIDLDFNLISKDC